MKKVMQRLKLERFAESRKQLSEGTFDLLEFVKGKTPSKSKTTEVKPPT